MKPTYPAPAKCFRCRARLGREQFKIMFPIENSRRTGHALLCAGCFYAHQTFLRGAPLGARA